MTANFRGDGCHSSGFFSFNVNSKSIYKYTIHLYTEGLEYIAAYMHVLSHHKTVFFPLAADRKIDLANVALQFVIDSPFQTYADSFTPSILCSIYVLSLIEKHP